MSGGQYQGSMDSDRVIITGLLTDWDTMITLFKRREMHALTSLTRRLSNQHAVGLQL